jgi:hypothetical protein
LTFSALFCLPLREKVEMESVGREAGGAWAAAGFSGESGSASVADGVLLCEDEPEAFVRSEALRERRNEVLTSATEEAMLWRDACLRRGGVVGGMGASSWCVLSAARGFLLSPSASDGDAIEAVGRTICGGVKVRERNPFLAKSEGRLLKMLPVKLAFEVEFGP